MVCCTVHSTPQHNFMLTSALPFLPRLLRVEIYILQSILVLRLYAGVAAFQRLLKSVGNTIWGMSLYFSVCLNLRKQRKHLCFNSDSLFL